MSDALPDDAWIQSFLSSPPRPLQQALQKRLHASTSHLNSLAELYKQRAAIETQYADSLAKLVRSAEQGSLLPKTSIEWDKSSGEGKLWDNIISELSEVRRRVFRRKSFANQQTSTSHSTLAALLKTDFERPLKELPSKIVAWRRVGDQDASLEKALKDYEKTSAKLEKASSKAKSSKTDVLSSELNSITSSLASLSPMVYTTYQRLDEERLRSLKEIIVRWGTVRADIAQRDSERAERAVALLISWETQDEVLAVGRKLGGGGGAAARASNAAAAPSLSSVSTTRKCDWCTLTSKPDFSAIRSTFIVVCELAWKRFLASSNSQTKWLIQQSLSASNKLFCYRYQVHARTKANFGSESSPEWKQRDFDSQRSRPRRRLRVDRRGHS